MLKPLLPAAAAFLMLLMAVVACTGAARAPDPTGTPTPNGSAATPALIVNAPDQEMATAAPPPASTEQEPAPTPIPTPTLTPSPSAEKAVTPASTPTPVATRTPTQVPMATTPTPTALRGTPTPAPTTTEEPEPTATPAPKSSPATATPAPNQPPSPTPGPTATHPATTTLLGPPPEQLGLDPFYERYLGASGLAIVASSEAADMALYRARDIVDEMLAERADLRANLAEQGVRVAVMAESAALTELPEFSDFGEFSPGVSWDERTKGGGVGPTRARPVVAIAEENLLCYENDIYPHEDIFVHEFAHGVLTMGILAEPWGPEFQDRLVASYRNAMDDGLWADTYAGENPDEYWAEGVQSWFGLNDPPGPIHNEVNTRSELLEYDPDLAGLIQEILGDGVIQASCHTTAQAAEGFRIAGKVLGPDGEPLQGIGLWAWQGDRSNSEYGRTDKGGRFSIPVQEGFFTLDIYPGEGCSFVGWYDGEGALATTRSRAATLEVGKEGIHGIEVRLPEQPDALPRIEWCS